MQKLPTMLILAGGFGTRLKSLTVDTPKSMVEINNKPFIFYQLCLLKKNNINNIVICTGHLSSKIENYVGNGKKFNLNISYSYDGESLLGTGGAVKKAANMISGPFFVLYGDSYLDICYKDVYDFYMKNNEKSVMTVIKNQDKWDKSNIVYKDNQIISYKKSFVEDKMEFIDYGLSIFKKDDLNNFNDIDNFDLSELHNKLLSKKQLIAFEVYKRFYEVGSLSGIKEFSMHLKNSGMAK